MAIVAEPIERELLWVAFLAACGVTAVDEQVDLVARIGAAGLGEHRRHKKPAPARQARCVCTS